MNLNIIQIKKLPLFLFYYFLLIKLRKYGLSIRLQKFTFYGKKGEKKILLKSLQITLIISPDPEKI